MTAMTAQDFNRYTGKAKTLAQQEPVFITDRGKIQYVLMSIDDYETLKLPEKEFFLENPFAVSEEEYFELEITRSDGTFREVDYL